MPRQATTIAQNAVQVPSTRGELTALAARRDELANQLNSLSDTRSRLVGERYGAQANNNLAIVKELDGRISELGARIKRIEAEKLQADDAIAAGISRVGASSEEFPLVAGAGTQVISLPGSGPAFPGDLRADRTEERIAAFGGLTVLMLAFMAYRWATRRSADQRRATELSVESEATKNLRVAVESIAVEVERISENQRFITKLLSETPEKAAALLERGDRDRR